MRKWLFGLAGAGWRAEYYLRIAKEMPERFQVCGIMVNDKKIRMMSEQKWGIKTYATLDELLQRTHPSFMVLAVPWLVTPKMIMHLSDRDMPVLSETPPAPDQNGLHALWKSLKKGARVQVAEQYPLQPLNAALIKLVESGLLGEVRQVQVSIAHAYHGMGLIRRLLGIKFEDAVIKGKRFVSKIVEGPDRKGPPDVEKIVDSIQDISIIDFNGKLAVFDFTETQYFSWFRSQRILIRGEKGEVNNNDVRYLKNYITPVKLELKRMDAGQFVNFEGYYHNGILMGDNWLYRNPFIPARFTDDEIGVASCIAKMGEYLENGRDFYSLAEACQDHYLGMMEQSAAESGETVQTMQQPWAT